MIQRFARFHRNLIDVFLHASTHVQQQNQRHWFVAVRKGDNRLRLPFIGHREVTLAEIFDELVALGDLHVHPHIRNAGFKRRGWLHGLVDVRRRGFCINLSRIAWRILGPKRR